MKVFILVLLSLLFNPLLALYNGNPAEPDWVEVGLWAPKDHACGIKLGYAWDDTFEKQIKVKQVNTTMSDHFGKWSTMKNMGALCLNIADRFEIYGQLGVMRLDLSEQRKDTARLDYHANNQFLFGVGGRAILAYWEKMVMGVNALYSGSSLDMTDIKENGKSRPSAGVHFKYREWQIGVSFSREIGIFNPYIGIAYSSLNSCLSSIPVSPHFLEAPSSRHLKTNNPFILLLGVGLANGKKGSINLESRLIGEQAISVAGNVRF